MNSSLSKRLKGLITLLQGVHHGGDSFSYSSRGTEREFFISHILNNIIAPPFRIGSGDIIDSSGKQSGQIDIVIEYANSISFPLITPAMPRLYLAEGVCSVIEIKSDLKNQWKEVVLTFTKLKPLKRNCNSLITIGKLLPNIPYFVVGYKGWSKKESLCKKMNEASIDGILTINPCQIIFRSEHGYHYFQNEEALFWFFYLMQQLTGRMIGAAPDYSTYLKNE